MGQILCRFLRCIFGDISKNQNVVTPDLEQGLSQPQTENPFQASPSSSTPSSDHLQFQQDDEENPLDDEIVKVEITTELIATSTNLIDDADQQLAFFTITKDDCPFEENISELDDLDDVVIIKANDERLVLQENVSHEFDDVIKADDKIRWIKHYNNGQKILLVGEGDFSFSSSLATAFISALNIIATSLDSLEFLRENYRKAISNIENLKKRGCVVMHGVNVAEMANHPLLKDLKFDRIIYNFPLAGFFPEESRQSQLRRNQTLVATFMENARKLLRANGEIHITHKCRGFFLDWNLERLGSNSGLRLVEELRFNYSDYPGYSTKCGFGGNNYFNCNPSKTYKFGLDI